MPEPDGVIAWEDPPAMGLILTAVSRPPVWSDDDFSTVESDLAAHPGRWAVVYEGRRSTTMHLAGLLRKRGIVEARAGKRGDGFAVWARASRG